MDAPQSRSPRRLWAEFAVIVVGVLVALWIDAGWSWLQDRQDEALVITDLKGDFTANLDEIDRLLGVRSELAALNFAALRRGVETIPADSLLPYTMAAFPVETFNPRRGALDAAYASGGISLLRDNELRSRLAAWGGLLDDAQEEVLAIDRINYGLLERLSEELMGPVFAMSGAAPLDESELRHVLDVAYSDPELRRVIALKSLVLVQAQAELQVLRAETAAILELLGS